MLRPTVTLLSAAQEAGYAIGAFNVYNLEGVMAVVAAAESEDSPAILQLHPAALKHGGQPLVALCLAAAREASVPMAVHLDHSSSADDIRAALTAGVPSVMADGSHLSYADNLAFTRQMVTLAHTWEATVEAELGRLSGTEDDLTVAEYEARFTDPDQAVDFVTQTHIDMLAVCIGNVHGHYRGEPRLDFERLAAIRQAVAIPLVLHGTSGLPDSMVQRAIELGVCKFNVNTEIRMAYVEALKERLAAPKTPDLTELMQAAISAMRAAISAKLRLFGSAGKISSRTMTKIQSWQDDQSSRGQSSKSQPAKKEEGSDRTAQLRQIAEAVQNLKESPLYEYRQKNGYASVIGEGNVQATIMFIGEAPGEKEAKTGRPFVGAAGKTLNSLLESIGLKREDVYITNIIKDRPPNNRDPKPDEIELYTPFLLKQLEIIQPEIIVTLGRFAMDFILTQFGLPEAGQKIGELHGQLLKAKTSYGWISIVPLYHPAAALYNLDLKETLKDDFQVLKQFI